jgi:hypothetical protein
MDDNENPPNSTECITAVEPDSESVNYFCIRRSEQPGHFRRFRESRAKTSSATIPAETL